MAKEANEYPKVFPKNIADFLPEGGTGFEKINQYYLKSAIGSFYIFLQKIAISSKNDSISNILFPHHKEEIFLLSAMDTFQEEYRYKLSKSASGYLSSQIDDLRNKIAEAIKTSNL